MNSAEILHKINKLKIDKRALYIAAHPDDENTALLTWLSHHALARTAYLSLTRGEGGQNLLGTVLGQKLGAVRTEELIKAREIDGALQFFTGAVDFGYSKTPEDTYSRWNKEKVLSDVVWVIRSFKPDIIITRFPTTGEGGHGHHTVSALLAEEAFHAASDKDRFSEQLDKVTVWKATRLVLNDFRLIRNPSFIPSDGFAVEIDGYNPLLGKWYGEISAEARTMHKTQGFGVPVSRAKRKEYFIHQTGTPLRKDLFDDVPKRVRDISAIEDSFDLNNPSKILAAIPDTPEFYDLFLSASGFFAEIRTDKKRVSRGETFEATLLAIHSANETLKLKSEFGEDILKQGTQLEKKIKITVKDNQPFTSPAWYKKDGVDNHYDIPQEIRVQVKTNQFLVTGELSLNEKMFPVSIPVVFHQKDPINGEIRYPLAILPKVEVKPKRALYVVNDHGKDHRESIALPDSYYSNTIYYPHIDPVTLVSESKIKVQYLSAAINGKHIGFIPGAGDEVHTGLVDLGYEVTEITRSTTLSHFDAIVVGVRAFNTNSWLPKIHDKLMRYIEHGGTVVAQYNVVNPLSNLQLPDIGPYPFSISRVRVTDENAAIKLLKPDHKIFNSPNKLTNRDFDGWVQERGLYFASEWDKRYTPLIACNDPGEPQQTGALLIAHYGKGSFIYCALSLFRQIPAAIPGAYRLLANLVSYRAA